MLESSLGRKIAIVTAVKLAALGLIYLLFFGAGSAGKIDPAVHIAGQSPLAASGTR